MERLLRSWVQTYSNWWWNEVENSPLHVLIETSLIVAILYIVLVKGTYNPVVR
jgi:hypothetical protein